MEKPPPDGPLLARGGHSASTTRGAHAIASRSDAGGPKDRAPEGFGRLLRVALAIVTVILCACIASPRQRAASFLVAAIDAPAQGQRASERSHHWKYGDSRRVAELAAVEVDLEDDDDPLCDVADEAAPAYRCVPAPHRSDRVARADLPRDTSRFAAGTGLPRGPPTCGT
jgi:hypothetical protein